jgi:hypothetical protein
MIITEEGSGGTGRSSPTNLEIGGIKGTSKNLGLVTAFGRGGIERSPIFV